MECNNIWKNILRRYETNFPEYAKDTIYWYPSGHYEITVKLKDGRNFKYDEITNVTKRIHTITDEDPYTDERIWRMEFANRLRRRMMVCCLRQETLSEISGISTVTLSKYVNAKATPSTFHLRKLARALKCSTAELTDF